MKEKVKRLYALQLREGGIAEDVFHFLPADEQAMLEEKGGRNFLRPEFRKLIKVVLTGGVFDIIHIGHVFTLNEAKKLGDVLARGYVETESTQAGEVPCAPEVPRLLPKVRPIQEFVKVDAHIPGCPPDADAIWYAVTELLAGRKPEWSPANMRYD